MGLHNISIANGTEAIWLERKDAWDVYNAFVPALTKRLGEQFEEAADVQLDMMGFISFDGLPDDDFNLAYQLIMEAELQPWLHNDLKQAFESDPRFKSVEVA